MRRKFLFLSTILACSTFVSAFGQKTLNENALPSTKTDTLSIKAKASATTRGADPMKMGASFQVEDIKPSADREVENYKSIFYSNAKMYVAENADASMYVEGTMKYDNEAQVKQVGQTVLTGDFVSLKDKRNTDRGDVVSLFDDSDADAKKGYVNFFGEGRRQYIIREDANGNPLGSSLGLIDGGLDNLLKVGTEYEYVIKFPNIRVDKNPKAATGTEFAWSVQNLKAKIDAGYDIEKENLLVVGSNVAMSVNRLDLTNDNRFSVDVVSQGLEKRAQGILPSSINELDYYRINPAYVKIGEMSEKGYNEVNMKLYEYIEAEVAGDLSQPLKHDDLVVETNMKSGLTIPNGISDKATFMRGFTSPLDNLYTDYMFYNVITRPDSRAIGGHNPASGEYEGPLASPKEHILPGVGYFVAMDVSNAYFENIKDRWHENLDLAYDKRARGGYNFSRLVQRMRDEYDRKGTIAGEEQFSLYTFDAADATAKRKHIVERFNLKEVDVIIPEPGGNNGANGLTFLGNPYMIPISMSGLLAKTVNGAFYAPAHSDSWASDPEFITPYTPKGFEEKTQGGVKAVHGLNSTNIANARASKTLLLRSTYWVPHSGLVANTKVNGKAGYAYNVKYDQVSTVTQATTVTKSYNRIIEPMQMFLVQAATGGTFTFTPDMQTFKGQAFAVQDLAPKVSGRSSFSVDNELVEDEAISKDWILIEAASESGDKLTVDRTAVRFFNGASQIYDNQYDQEKFFTPTEVQSAGVQGRALAADLVESTAPNNMLYTASVGASPRQLLSHGVGYDTKEIPLYYVSGGVEENVTLTFAGMDGFDRLENVKLIDRFKDTESDIYEGFVYSFVTMPGKETVNGENRFVLKFGDSDDEEPSYTVDPITCYYSGSILHIGGLNEKDLNSKVQIFDLQGRLMGSTTINNYPTMEYPKALGQGTFIVNIIGNRNYKTKFVNLQNY